MTKTFAGRIGIIGSGALGALYGARLAKAGHDVHFLMRSDYDEVRQNGLRIQSFEGDFEIRPPVYRTPEEMGVCDLLIIGLKTTSNGALRGLLGPTAGKETRVLTLQNGLGNEDAIVEVLGEGSRSRVMGGIAFLCSNRMAPGVIHHIDQGWIRMGESSGAATDSTHQVAALFTSAGIRCEVYDELLRARWEKLVWNIPFNGLGVAAKANVAEVLGTPELRALARGLMEDAVAGAEASGTAMDGSIMDKMLKNSESMGPYRSSMQIDYENGNPLEVESIIGEPLRRAKSGGAEVPRLEMLYALVKQLNPGQN